MSDEVNNTVLISAAPLADALATHRDEPSLHKFARENSLAGIRLTLALGTNPNSINNRGDAAAHAAAYSDSSEALMLLREKGADLNAKGALGMTPLMVASRQDNAKTIEILSGLPEVDLDARDDTGKTALMHAAYKGAAKAVFILKNAGADVTLKDHSDQTALQQVNRFTDDCADVLKGTKVFVSAEDLAAVLGDRKANGVLALNEVLALN